MAEPKISVIVPSYNQGDFLEQTLRSVIDQNYPSLELLVIDGGSSDNSVNVIRKYENSISYWVSEPDEGQTHALSKGFDKSTGDIQCWLNSDDLHEPGVLQEVADYFKTRRDMIAVYGNTVWIDYEGRVLRKHREIPFNRFLWLYTYNYIPGMSMFWRRSAYEQVGGLDTSFNLSMDADLWIRMSHVGKIAHVNRFWSRMRFYPEQKNRALRNESDREDMVIRAREWGVEKPAFYVIKRQIAQAVRMLWRAMGGCYTPGYRRFMEKGKPR